MNFPSLLKGRDAYWNIAIAGTVAAALVLNIAGLLVGITMVLPHLLYIPVVIASYRYPRQGLLFSGCVGGVYLLMVVVIAGGRDGVIAEAAVRTGVVILIGWLIAALTLRLREQESLYQGLFDHSEAGSILVRIEGDQRTVEEANWNAATLLGKDPADMKGTPLASFWSEEEENEVFSRFAREGRVYATEVEFSNSEGGSHDVLLSVAPVPGGRAILTFTDITRRVNAERSLQTANDKLSLLSRISNDHLHRTVNEIIETVDEADRQVSDESAAGFIGRIRSLAWNLARQLFLTETYQDLGAAPPAWIPVQRVLERMAGSTAVSRRFWVERLEVYADPLFRDVFMHLVENALRHGDTVKNITVTYHRTGDGIDIVVEDDGRGVPEEVKEAIFEYDSGGHAGLGLYICRQILSVTDMTITEEGKAGKGARFVIHVPEDYFRIEGSEGEAPPFPLPEGRKTSLSPGATHTSGTFVRELISAEFPVANELWIDYHETKGDPAVDRIFAAFVDGEAVSIARCRRHPDGLEVDGVFTPVRFRGHGYANASVWGLVEACGREPLYMHSVVNLTEFYGHYEFVPIDEKDLPTTIRERFAWAQGEMEGANVCPMKRDAAG